MIPPHLSARHLHFLDALRIHPLMSLEQLALFLNWQARRVQVYLTQLRQMGLVYPIHPRHPNVPVQSLWALTLAGWNVLKQAAWFSQPKDWEEFPYTRTRLEWLLLHSERVYHIRKFLLQLKRMPWEWSLQTWNVEVEAQFLTDDDLDTDHTAHLSGIAQLKNAQDRWVTLAIEYDTNLMPVKGERARLKQFVRLITLSDFNDPHQYLFPIYVVIAANREREREYHALLLELAFKMGWLMPYTFFIRREHLSAFYADPAARIWESDLTWGEGKVTFLDQIQGAPQRTTLVDWRALPVRQSASDQNIELKPLAVGTSLTHSRRDLAALTLSLLALDKQVLALLADHPLLDASELAFILQMPVRSIRRCLKRLRQWGLVKAYAYRRASAPMCYVLTDKAIWLLTAWAGLGTATKTYAHLRGWDEGFGGLIKHKEHTRLENQIYLQFLREARTRGHTLMLWRSELEAQIYSEKLKLAPHRRLRPAYERVEERSEIVGGDSVPALEDYGRNMARFLPDGSGVYVADNQYYVIAVEVDRSKANTQKMKVKLNYYNHTLYERDDVTWRILIVTTGWKRARHLADLVLQDALDALLDDDVEHLRGEALMTWLKEREMFAWWPDRLLPVFITTMDALKEYGVAGKVWLNAWSAIYPQNDEKMYCLECFQPQAG